MHHHLTLLKSALNLILHHPSLYLAQLLIILTILFTPSQIFPLTLIILLIQISWIGTKYHYLNQAHLHQSLDWHHLPNHLLTSLKNLFLPSLIFYISSIVTITITAFATLLWAIKTGHLYTTQPLFRQQLTSYIQTLSSPTNLNLTSINLFLIVTISGAIVTIAVNLFAIHKTISHHSFSTSFTKSLSTLLANPKLVLTFIVVSLLSTIAARATSAGLYALIPQLHYNAFTATQLQRLHSIRLQTILLTPLISFTNIWLSAYLFTWYHHHSKPQ